MRKNFLREFSASFLYSRIVEAFLLLSSLIGPYWREEIETIIEDLLKQDPNLEHYIFS